MNNGTCNDMGRCTCTELYTGVLCEEAISGNCKIYYLKMYVCSVISTVTHLEKYPSSSNKCAGIWIPKGFILSNSNLNLLLTLKLSSCSINSALRGVRILMTLAFLIPVRLV